MGDRLQVQLVDLVEEEGDRKMLVPLVEVEGILEVEVVKTGMLLEAGVDLIVIIFITVGRSVVVLRPQATILLLKMDL